MILLKQIAFFAGLCPQDTRRLDMAPCLLIISLAKCQSWSIVLRVMARTTWKDLGLSHHVTSIPRPPSHKSPLNQVFPHKDLLFRFNSVNSKLPLLPLSSKTCNSASTFPSHLCFEPANADAKNRCYWYLRTTGRDLGDEFIVIVSTCHT